MSGASTRVGTLIGGTGLAGLMTGLRLHAAGRPVLIAEARAASELSRRQIVILQHDSLRWLEEVGAPVERYAAGDGRQGLVSLRRLEQDLRALAHERGLMPRYNTPVTGVRQLHDGGVQVTLRDGATGAEELFHADEFVNATGGRVRIEREVRDPASGQMAIQPAQEFDLVAQPGEVGFAAAFFDYQPQLGAQISSNGYLRPRRPLRGFNTELDGAHLILKMPTRRKAFYKADILQRAWRMGIEGMPTETYLFNVRQRLAGTARQRDVLSVGESISKLHFGESKGANLALRDGTHVADAILAGAESPGAREAAYSHYGSRALNRHDVAVQYGQDHHMSLAVIRDELGRELKSAAHEETGRLVGRLRSSVGV